MTEVRTVFAGVSTVLVTDGSSAVLVDGYFSRPSVRRLFTRVLPDQARITAGLERLGVRKLDAVLVAHAHVDHVLDAPVVAHRTGAALAGDASIRQVQVGYGLPDSPFVELQDGAPVTFGAFTVTPVAGIHSHGDVAPGAIAAPVRLPARSRDFRTGTCWTFHIAHPTGSVVVHGSANFVPGVLSGLDAELIYLGIGAVGRQDDAWRENYWHETVTAVGARVVRPVHWDAFWRPIDRGLRPIPRPLDHLDVTMATLNRLAAEQDVDLRLPQAYDEETLA
jgi:L-ascorbate metabolism protein UlaG (beta-lactamase superfamily)